MSQPRSVKEEYGCPSNDLSGDTVIVCNAKTPGQFKVANKKVEPIRIQSVVRVEVQVDDGTWHVTSQQVDLRQSRTPGGGAECLVLEPGDELKPLLWGGFDCTNPYRPNCSGRYTPSGDVRFVVVSCDQSQRFEGPPLRHIEYTNNAM